MTAPGFSVSVPAAGEIHLWWASIDVGDAVLASLREDLDDDRRARVDRFVQEADRRRGTVAHGLLRRLAGSALGVPAREVAFGYHCAGCGGTDHGKPHLLAPAGVPPEGVPQVNISHSGDLVAVALADARSPIGVDVEFVKAGPDWAQLRRSVFTDLEWETSRLAEDPHQARYRYWVAKESALKAIGTGLSTPMREVEMVPALTSDDGGFRTVDPAGRPVEVAPVTTAPGHLAAVASLARITAVSVRRSTFFLP